MCASYEAASSIPSFDIAPQNAKDNNDEPDDPFQTKKGERTIRLHYRRSYQGVGRCPPVSGYFVQ